LVQSVISHYELFEKLGEGGMGVVYKAQDTKLDRIVALKFLSYHLTANETERARFLQEAKVAGALNHPNICTIYGIEEQGDEKFIVMEFVDGKTLRTQISDLPSPVPLDQIVDWGLQIGEALAAAHEKGIAHRDIKPDNIMVTAKNQIKVMDFGLAKLKGSSGLTRSGSSVGTIAYMSPEQIQGLEVDHRTDLWALGAILYEMLGGQHPFRGQHEATIMYEILNVQPKAIQTLRPESPEHLQVLVSRLLQKDPAKRISSAAEIVQLLKRPAAETPSARGEKSIAVLYFENMSSDKEGDYFCAGMTEDIITDLSKIKVLQVVSRTDVLPFRNKEVNTRQVGEVLNVNYILEGSVRKAGDRMRITAQLIDVRTGFHLWAERFDRLVEDIFDLQNEVSHKIADALKVSLTESEKQLLAQRPTDDLRAYDFYMRGQELLHRRGRRNNDAAIQMFENAVAIDPTLASAYAGLAEAYSYMYEWYDGDATWLAKGIEMNQKALTLDPTSTEARFGIAVVYFHQKRLKEARRILEGIFHENSQFYPACMRLGMISEISGDLDSALQYFRRASGLKPYEDDPWMHMDRIYRRKGLHESAEEAAQKVIEVTSKKLEASLDDLIVMSRLAQAYARFGAREEAYATLKAVLELDQTDGLALYNCSCAYALLGEKNKALVSLRSAFESGFKAVMNTAKTEDAFNALRDDPEFRHLMADSGQYL
jgi:serine/threonine protein kinase/tetratricopeptide (TPR) repeat protein